MKYNGKTGYGYGIGIAIVGLAIGLIGVGLEVVKREPIGLYLLLASAGCFVLAGIFGATDRNRK